MHVLGAVLLILYNTHKTCHNYVILPHPILCAHLWYRSYFLPVKYESSVKFDARSDQYLQLCQWSTKIPRTVPRPRYIWNDFWMFAVVSRHSLQFDRKRLVLHIYQKKRRKKRKEKQKTKKTDKHRGMYIAVYLSLSPLRTRTTHRPYNIMAVKWESDSYWYPRR